MNNKKSVFVVNNASIHKTKEISEYVRNDEIQYWLFLSIFFALNGAETIIQALKSKINCQRGNEK